jgi:hopene-associated glycosyltransferase HpnB
LTSPPSTVLLTLHAVAALPLVIWLYLLFGRGGFWRVPRRFPQPSVAAAAKSIVAVIPARDEAPVVGRAVESLLRQRSIGSIHVVVIDDGSSDDTAAAALAAGDAVGAATHLTVLRGAPLAPAWTGKLWAMSQGIAFATARRPDYLLLTDADIHHEPDNLAALVAHAEEQRYELVSSMVKLSVASFAERWLMPAFVFFFFKLYPPAWIASSRFHTAGAAGGCMLIRPETLVRIGGWESIRAEIIDDCALARAVKGAGGSVWLGLTRGAYSLRSYGTLREIGSLISRTAFNQLRHSYGLLVATIAGLGVTYLAPPLLLLSGDPVAITLGAAAWTLMSFAYGPMVRFYGGSPLWSASLPAIALFYGGATVHSAAQYALGRGGQWKGRAQDANPIAPRSP